MIPKGTFIKNLTSRGQTVDGVFAVSGVSRNTDKNGNSYWALTLSDTTGALPARIWGQNGTLTPTDLDSEIFAFIQGQVQFFRDICQIRIDAIRPLSEELSSELDPEDFTPPSRYDTDKLFQELMALSDKEFIYPPWRKLIHNYFGNEHNISDFLCTPAGKNMHHTGPGGLLAHTYEVFRICRSYADLFPSLDRQTLLAGALFHDIGKVREMTHSVFETTYTPEGNLFGHMVLGVTMLEPYCKEAELPVPLVRHFFHLILSHHGKIEYGAVKEPCTMEALALHSADYLDAHLDLMSKNLESIKEGKLTSFVRELGHTLFCPSPTPLGNDAVQTQFPSSVSSVGGGSPATLVRLPESAPSMEKNRNTGSVERGKKEMLLKKMQPFAAECTRDSNSFLPENFIHAEVPLCPIEHIPDVNDSDEHLPVKNANRDDEQDLDAAGTIKSMEMDMSRSGVEEIGSSVKGDALFFERNQKFSVPEQKSIITAPQIQDSDKGIISYQRRAHRQMENKSANSVAESGESSDKSHLVNTNDTGQKQKVPDNSSPKKSFPKGHRKRFEAGSLFSL